MDITEQNELERLIAQREGVAAPEVDYTGLTPETQRQIRKLIDKDTVDKDRTWSWYMKLRKEDPQKYNQERRYMQRDARLLGDSFKDGDFEDRDYF